MAKITERTIRIPRRRLSTKIPKILGLDCSSTTIGWGLISWNLRPVLLAHGYIKPLSNKYPLLERLNDVDEKVTKLCADFAVSHVAVEDIFLFMKGQSRAQTIVVLAAFNRVAALASYRKTKNVIFYSVHNIRRLIRDNLELEDKIGKTDMPLIIKAHLESKFENIINKRGNIAKETFDEADGIAAAWACSIDLGINNGSL